MKNRRRLIIQKVGLAHRARPVTTQLESNYGIGKIQSKLICNQLGISSNLRNLARPKRPSQLGEAYGQMTKYEKKRVMDYLRKRTRIITNYVSNPQSKQSI